MVIIVVEIVDANSIVAAVLLVVAGRGSSCGNNKRSSSGVGCICKSKIDQNTH